MGQPHSAYLSKPYGSSPLLHFLDAYFHPDWHLDDASAAEVVDRWLRTSSGHDATEVAVDIGEVLDQYDEPGVAELVARHMDNIHLADRAGLDRRQWLGWLQQKAAG